MSEAGGYAVIEVADDQVPDMNQFWEVCVDISIPQVTESKELEYSLDLMISVVSL